jgi:small subunit ribosomal protein S2
METVADQNTDNVEQPEKAEKVLPPITLQSLLEVGAHFGGPTGRWHPNMAPYIYGARNGVYVIDLERSVELWKQAEQVIIENAASGGQLLFVGTKRQASENVEKFAQKCNSPFVQNKWLGGTLTNLDVVKNAIHQLNQIDERIEKINNKGLEQFRMTKKEFLELKKTRERLHQRVGGIRRMYGLPTMMFVVDVRAEANAIAEAQTLDIPVIAMIDTDSNPESITYPIPANDDSRRTIELILSSVAHAVNQGKLAYAAKRSVEEKMAAEQSKLEEKKNAKPKRSPKRNNKRVQRAFSDKESRANKTNSKAGN